MSEVKQSYVGISGTVYREIEPIKECNMHILVAKEGAVHETLKSIDLEEFTSRNAAVLITPQQIRQLLTEYEGLLHALKALTGKL